MIQPSGAGSEQAYLRLRQSGKADAIGTALKKSPLKRLKHPPLLRGWYKRQLSTPVTRTDLYNYPIFKPHPPLVDGNIDYPHLSAVNSLEKRVDKGSDTGMPCDKK